MLSAVVFFLVDASLDREAVLDWGWRIPFLFGILLGAATLTLRRAVLDLDRPPPVDRALPIVEPVRNEGRHDGRAQSIGMPPVTGTSAPDM